MNTKPANGEIQRSRCAFVQLSVQSGPRNEQSKTSMNANHSQARRHMPTGAPAGEAVDLTSQLARRHVQYNIALTFASITCAVPSCTSGAGGRAQAADVHHFLDQLADDADMRGWMDVRSSPA